MKVILLEELKGRGGEGDVIEVATGYAVNFLFPKKIAIQATRGNLKQLELRKHNIAKREATRLDSAEKMLEALDGQMLRIGARVGEEGQLFGSVTPLQVAEAINAKFGTQIDRKHIDLHEIIKKAGEHTATVSIYRDTKANITIEVVDEKKLAELEHTDAPQAEEAPSEEAVEGAEVAEAEAVVEAEAEAVVEVAEEAPAEAEAAEVVEAEAEAAVEVEAEAAEEAPAEAAEVVEVEVEVEAEAVEAVEAEAPEADKVDA